MADMVKYEIKRGEFGWALEELKRGKRVRRPHWRSDPECLAQVGMPTGDNGRVLYAKIVMVGKFGEWCGWTAKSDDMLATDWLHYEEDG